MARETRRITNKKDLIQRAEKAKTVGELKKNVMEIIEGVEIKNEK